MDTRPFVAEVDKRSVAFSDTVLWKHLPILLFAVVLMIAAYRHCKDATAR